MTGSATSRLERLAALAHRHLGLDLGRSAVAAAIERYVERYQGAGEAAEPAPDLDSRAFQALVDAVTVQHSWLFRDSQQLELACGSLMRKHNGVNQVWVPACATGEDVYSLLALCDSLGLEAEALGSDVNAKAVEQARLGKYGASSVRNVPRRFRGMLRGEGESQEVVESLRKKASFRLHNLLEAAPASRAAHGKWDLIVCRNVLIYFSPEHVTRALLLLRDALAPEGTLVLGASDIVTELPVGLVARELGGRIFFQRQSEVTTDIRSAPRAQLRVVPAPAVLRPTGPKLSEPADSPHLDAAPGVSDQQLAVQHLLAGIEKQLAGELAEALSDLRAAVFLLPALWPAWYYLALTNEGLGRQEEARRCYATAGLQIGVGAPLPLVPGHDFSFLQQDLARVVSSRAR